LRVVHLNTRNFLNNYNGAIEKLIESCGGDIRQIINVLQMWRLNKKQLTQSDVQRRMENAKKNLESSLGPFDVAVKFLRYPDYTKSSFNDKQEYYFTDYSLIPLMIQENYIHVKPLMAANPPPIPRFRRSNNADVNHMELLSKAADAISDSDLCINLIMRQQKWELLPDSAVLSSIMPGYYMQGTISQQLSFPMWLGKYSTTAKRYRLLKDLQVHMSTKITADKNEIRLQYLPAIIPNLINPLIQKQTEGIDDVIKFMEAYYGSRDDWDYVVEINSGFDLSRSVQAETKTSFSKS